MHTFSGLVEHAIAHIEEAALHNMPEEQQRWYAIKIFERDDKVLAELNIPHDVMDHIENDIKAAEKELDDDAESHHHQRALRLHRLHYQGLLQEEERR